MAKRFRMVFGLHDVAERLGVEPSVGPADDGGPEPVRFTSGAVPRGKERRPAPAEASGPTVKPSECPAECPDGEEHVFEPMPGQDEVNATRFGCDRCGLIIDDCPACGGSGLGAPYCVAGDVVEDDCPRCSGRGYLPAVDDGPAASSAHDPATTTE